MINKLLKNKLSLLALFSLVIIILYLITPLVIMAANEPCTGGIDPDTNILTYCPLVPEAFSDFNTGTAQNQLGQFLAQAFQFGLAMAAALAVIMIVWGGVEIMLSESLFKKEDGKKKVWDAFWGLLLALISWLILYTINPEILNWTFLDQHTLIDNNSINNPSQNITLPDGTNMTSPLY